MLRADGLRPGALVAIGACLLVASCSGSTTVDGANPLGIDEQQISLVPFPDVTTSHCLGAPYPVDDLVQTVTCDLPGAVEIAAVTTFGTDAPPPGTDPTPEVVGGYAEDACTEPLARWSEENGLTGASFLRTITFPLEWDGPDTYVVCGARA